MHIQNKTMYEKMYLRARLIMMILKGVVILRRVDIDKKKVFLYRPLHAFLFLADFFILKGFAKQTRSQIPPFWKTQEEAIKVLEKCQENSRNQDPRPQNER